MLASLMGVVTSLIFSYVPGLKARFESLSSDYKKLVMIGILFLVVLGVYGASCFDLYMGITCDLAGAKTMLSLFISALVANQTTYLLSPKKK